MSDLREKSCAPIQKGTPALDEAGWKPLLEQLGDGWEVKDGRLQRDFIFPAFETGLDFVNKTGGLAGQEGHHPDLHLDRRKVQVSLRTHDVDGLSENDFILAAKITDAITSQATARMVDVSALKGDAPTASGMTKLDADAVTEKTKALGEAWSVTDDGRLARSFERGDYVSCLTLINRIGTLARDRRHHPGLDLLHGKVIVRLYTYPAEGLTQLDFELAAAIEDAGRS